MPKSPKRFDCELLRVIVRNMDATTESFNQRYDLQQLLAIYRAHLASDWDIYPDQWSAAQLRAAIEHGEPPRFQDDGTPCPPMSR